jgi:phenylalanyl-tRNA synthetase beta chain
MRISLIPGIWRNVAENSKYFDAFRLFEIGHQVHKQASGHPTEVPHLAAVLYAKDDGVRGLFEVKRLAECLLPGISVEGAVNPRPFEHPNRTYDVRAGNETVGRIFEFHPNMVENGRAAVLDLNLEMARSLASQDRRYKAIRRFPSSSFDLSIVAAPKTTVGEISGQIRSWAAESVERMECVAIFPLPDGRKSVSFRFTLASEDRTLTSEEIGKARESLIERLHEHNYEIRGE